MKRVIAFFAIVVTSVFAGLLHEKCKMPEDFGTYRQNRVLHPCESIHQFDYAIESNQYYYCIYASNLNSQVFGRNFYTITISGGFDYEQKDAEGFNMNGQTLSFWTKESDAIIYIERKEEETIISNFFLKVPGDLAQNEKCPVNCGRQNNAIAIIIGGTNALRGNWPWNAALYMNSGTAINFRCGATIISTKTLITTAKCLISDGASIRADKLLIGIGELTLYSPNKERKILKVEKTIQHENFNGTNFHDDNNIGLIIVKLPIEFNVNVKPICLPESDEFNFEGKMGMIVGWGYNEKSELTFDLKQLEVPTYEFMECFYNDRKFFGGYSSVRNFCAGHEKNLGICTGDTGGGLFIKQNERFYIFGISSVANCYCTTSCKITGEAIFGNVPAYLKWIQTHMME